MKRKKTPPADGQSIASEKLQKALASAGLGSRREMERWIESGFIKVNDQVVPLGIRVTAQDKIKVKGKLIRNPLAKTRQTRVIIYHKPQGVLCTKSDPEGRKTVFDELKKLDPNRWILVGRLDMNTSGLLLLTNNGELANRLMHPSYEIEREYAIRVNAELTEQQQSQLLKGVELEDGMAAFGSLLSAGGDGMNRWYHATLKEGRNREVRRMIEHLGLQVSRLIRVRFGNLELPRYLRRGHYKDLSSEDVLKLKQLVSLTSK